MTVDTTGVPEPLATTARSQDLTDAAVAQAYVTAYLNLQSLLAKGAAALTANATYLAIGAPTPAQVGAQVAALTRQVDALIRVAATLLDSTTGT